MDYAYKKSVARDAAISWQLGLTGDESYGEIAAAQSYFGKLARRYGLTREFRENGIL